MCKLAQFIVGSASIIRFLGACTPNANEIPPTDSGSDTTGSDAEDTAGDAETADAEADDGQTTAADAPSGEDARTFVAVTFNTGSGLEMPHDALPDDGYSSAEATLTDLWYGNGLAWRPLVADVAALLEDLRPDLVVFQEIFDVAGCAAIPEEARAGFVCEHPAPAPVASQVLGDGWQLACHPDRTDKCLAVRETFATFRGCAAERCDDALVGLRVAGCGSGARIAWAELDLVAGGALRVANVHGSSGFTADDTACRVRQFEALFGPEGPLGAGDTTPVLVLGDFNTDLGRLPTEASSARLLELAASSRLTFLTDTTAEARPTYQGVFNIDHVLADGLDGDCAGVPRPDFTNIMFFDHEPLRCALSLE